MITSQLFRADLENIFQKMNWKEIVININGE